MPAFRSSLGNPGKWERANFRKTPPPPFHQRAEEKIGPISIIVFASRFSAFALTHIFLSVYVFLSSEHLYQPNHQSFQGSRPCEQKQGQSYRPGIAHHRTNCITEERKLERSLFSEIFPIAKKNGADIFVALGTVIIIFSQLGQRDPQRKRSPN